MQMKFKAHQSFFIRKGWLSKGLHAIQNDESGTILMPSNNRKAMDELGLGANQVVALRYWLHSTGLIGYGKNNRRINALTPFGKLVLEQDPYTEEVGTLWALHCNLVSARENAAAWYFFFNEFNMSVFNREDFTRALERHIFVYNNKKQVALASLEADFSCILNTYIPHYRLNRNLVSPESVIDCPLGELGLLDVENREVNTFRKMSAHPKTLPSLLVLYAICVMRDIMYMDDTLPSTEIRLEVLLDSPCSPGRVFNLDSVGLLNKLYELENDGFLRINRTAGLDVIRLSRIDMKREDCLSLYYKEMG